MDNCRRKKELHLTAGSLNVATSPSITEYNPVPSIGRECPCGRAAAGRGDGDAFLATIVSAVLPPAAPGHHDTRQPCEGDVILQILFISVYDVQSRSKLENPSITSPRWWWWCGWAPRLRRTGSSSRCPRPRSPWSSPRPAPPASPSPTPATRSVTIRAILGSDWRLRVS